MILLFIYLFTALFISFTCSIAESVLLSSPVSFLKAKAKNGDRNAAKFLKQKEDVDRPLSAILSLNTVAHTVGAAGVGAQTTVVFGEEYFGWASAILTLLILVLTEIIPKTIGASQYKSLYGLIEKIIRIMIFITYPLVVLSAFITRLMSKKEEQSTSREEISALADIGTQEGIFHENENKIIQNVFDLNRLKVSKIMTPRTVCVTADEEMTLREFMRDKKFQTFSRIPVYKENIDEISGYVLRLDAYEKLAEDRFDMKLKEIKREITAIPETVSVYAAWERLLNQKEHIAYILNEYGGMDGIVTMEDIIETLMGIEILDERDTVSDMQEYAIQKWKNKQRLHQLKNQLTDK